MNLLHPFATNFFRCLEISPPLLLNQERHRTMPLRWSNKGACPKMKQDEIFIVGQNKQSRCTEKCPIGKLKQRDSKWHDKGGVGPSPNFETSSHRHWSKNHVVENNLVEFFVPAMSACTCWKIVIHPDLQCGIKGCLKFMKENARRLVFINQCNKWHDEQDWICLEQRDLKIALLVLCVALCFPKLSTWSHFDHTAHSFLCVAPHRRKGAHKWNQIFFCFFSGGWCNSGVIKHLILKRWLTFVGDVQLVMTHQCCFRQLSVIGTCRCQGSKTDNIKTSNFVTFKHVETSAWCSTHQNCKTTVENWQISIHCIARTCRTVKEKCTQVRVHGTACTWCGSVLVQGTYR